MTNEAGDFLKPTEGKLSIRYSGATEASTKHPDRNEDSMAFNREQGWAVILDGMGGKENGRLASMIGLRVVTEGLTNLKNFNTSKIDELEKILDDANANLLETGGGATVVVANLYQSGSEQRVFIAHIGDSRAYILQDSKLKRLTNDSAESKEDIAMLDRLDVVNGPGEMTIVERKEFGNRSRTKALGSSKMYPMEYLSQKIESGDKILLTSDGVHDNLTTAEIEEVLKGGGDVSKDLIKKAKERSKDDDHWRRKPDDISAIVMEVE